MRKDEHERLCRAALAMHEAGTGLAEIAREQGVSVGTVRRRIATARDAGWTSPRLPRMSALEVVEVARGIVTSELLIADLDDQDWRHSLMLLLQGWAKEETIPVNIGLILVPVSAHMGGLWLNGHVPGCTTSARLVAEEDRELVRGEVERMHAALYPEEAVSE